MTTTLPPDEQFATNLVMIFSYLAIGLSVAGGIAAIIIRL